MDNYSTTNNTAEPISNEPEVKAPIKKNSPDAKIEALKLKIAHKKENISKIEVEISKLETQIKHIKDVENQKQLKTLGEFLSQNKLSPMEAMQLLGLEKK